jgi:pilus assembly protein CpaF
MNRFEMILPFLKPIEHLILDDSINEVMVNGANRVFIEKQGSLQQVSGVSLGEKSLTVAVKNIARRLGMTSPNRSPPFDQ